MFRPHLTEPGVETKITEKGTRLNDYTAKEKQNKRDKYKISPAGSSVRQPGRHFWSPDGGVVTWPRQKLLHGAN